MCAVGSYDAPAGTYHGTLTAGTVDRVALTRDATAVEVLNRSATDEIYFTVDGPDPAVAAAGTQVVTAGSALEVAANASAVTTVRLISSGPAAYSVRGL